MRLPRSTDENQSKIETTTTADENLTADGILKLYAEKYITRFNRADSTLDQLSTRKKAQEHATDVGTKLAWNRDLIKQFINWTIDRYHRLKPAEQNPFWLLLCRGLIDTFIRDEYRKNWQPGDFDLPDIEYPVHQKSAPKNWKRDARKTIDATELDPMVKFVAYLVIEACDFYTRDTWVSRGTLAKRANCGLSTIKRSLVTLEKFEYITRQKRFHQDGSQTSDLIQFKLANCD